MTRMRQVVLSSALALASAAPVSALAQDPGSGRGVRPRPPTIDVIEPGQRIDTVLDRMRGNRAPAPPRASAPPAAIEPPRDPKADRQRPDRVRDRTRLRRDRDGDGRPDRPDRPGQRPGQRIRDRRRGG